MNLDIVPAGPACVGLLSRLHQCCFAEGWREPAMADLLAMPGAFALLARHQQGAEAVPVGFALARMAAREGEIITFGVLPDHRMSGIGGALLRTLIERCAALTADTLYLEVAADNVAAIALYRANEFVPAGRRPGYYQASSDGAGDAIVMRRDIK